MHAYCCLIEIEMDGNIWVWRSKALNEIWEGLVEFSAEEERRYQQRRKDIWYVREKPGRKRKAERAKKQNKTKF